jgi:hypothetical protein
MDPANLLTKRHWIVELARRKLGDVLYSLNHVIDFEWMREAYLQTRRDGVGLKVRLIIPSRGGSGLAGMGYRSIPTRRASSTSAPSAEVARMRTARNRRSTFSASPTLG